MNDESGGKDRTGITSTSVDLGDDLLEATRTHARTRTMTMPGSAATKPEQRREVADDDFQSAKILFGEGLVDEAKKVLRKILIGDPGNAPAKQMLVDIQNQEIKQIFGGAPKRRRFAMPEAADGMGGLVEGDLERIDPEALLQGLDRDLGLGLFDERSGSLLDSQATEAEAQLQSSLEMSLQGATPRDRLDVGIGLLEVGMVHLALRQFQLAKEAIEGEKGHELALALSSLLAQAQLRCELPHDAIATLQLALMESSETSDRKIELVYVLGRANEKLGRDETAHAWYLRVAEIDATYRDVQERLARTSRAGPKP